MIELTTSIYICIALIVYYAVFQLFSDFIKAGMKRNTPNALIAKLRTDYSVNIRTFQKNNNLYGFAWFKSIWINENLFRNKKLLMFTFYHEYYHLKHHHKKKILLLRLAFSFIPLLLALIPWYIFLVIFLSSALSIHYITQNFEDKANEYARAKK